MLCCNIKYLARCTQQFVTNMGNLLSTQPISTQLPKLYFCSDELTTGKKEICKDESISFNLVKTSGHIKMDPNILKNLLEQKSIAEMINRKSIYKKNGEYYLG